MSIARRLQDPLAELVKIEPKAIGVGQYQHDVNPHRMAKALDARVEDCVNAVGVLVNSASAALLSRVSGLSSTVADNIIRYRDEHGPFKTRKALLEVPRLGPKVYEQAAGFLRIADGDQPLDASSVHPEAYPVVERIVKSCGREVKQLIGDGNFLRTLKPEKFTDEQFGVPTVRDILKELEKPGRDPRPEFKAAQFAEGVESLEDLEARDDSRRRGEQRRGVRRVRGYRRAPGRADSHLGAVGYVCERSARGREGRRHREGARRRGGSAAQAHRAVAPARSEPFRTARRGSR